MITIPIEVGDTILTGKFRNHRVLVKEIGTDAHGSPTVNGKTILKIRLLPKGDSMKISKSQLHEIVGALTCAGRDDLAMAMVFGSTDSAAMLKKAQEQKDVTAIKYWKDVIATRNC